MYLLFIIMYVCLNVLCFFEESFDVFWSSARWDSRVVELIALLIFELMKNLALMMWRRNDWFCAVIFAYIIRYFFFRLAVCDGDFGIAEHFWSCRLSRWQGSLSRFYCKLRRVWSVVTLSFYWIGFEVLKWTWSRASSGLNIPWDSYKTLPKLAMFMYDIWKFSWYVIRHVWESNLKVSTRKTDQDLFFKLNESRNNAETWKCLKSSFIVVEACFSLLFYYQTSF